MPASSDKAQDRQSGSRLFEHAIQGRMGIFATLNFPIRPDNGIFGCSPGFAMEDGDQSRPTITFLRGTAGWITKKACSFEQIDRLL
jgi:hypothetical protein